MRTDLPSLIALQAFEAALRHESFSRAAEELYRTQGAVSRQIASLEKQLGAELFRREPPRVVPTPAAIRYGRKVRAILERLAAATLEMHSAADGGVLELAILPTFGTRWLIPRTRDFYRSEPGVLLHLSTRIGLFDFEVELLDAAVHYGAGHWPGAELERLFEEEVVVVCSPELAAESDWSEPGALIDAPLLQLETRLPAWGEWFAAHGHGAAPVRGAARFEHHLMVIQAAIAGLGVALLPSFLVHAELERGELVEPLPGTRATFDKAYWLAYPERSLDLPAFERFRGWLRQTLVSEGLAP